MLGIADHVWVAAVRICVRTNGAVFNFTFHWSSPLSGYGFSNYRPTRYTFLVSH